VGTAGLALAALPFDDLKKNQVEIAIIVLLVACAVGAIVVLRTIQKATTRLLLLGIFLVAGIGLWWQREELEDCQGQCTCRVFAQDVRMPDIGGAFCPENEPDL
jgi:hypothetical protein